MKNKTWQEQKSEMAFDIDKLNNSINKLYKATILAPLSESERAEMIECVQTYNAEINKYLATLTPVPVGTEDC